VCDATAAIGGGLSAISSIAGGASSTAAQNKAAMADYKYGVAKRDADWKQVLSSWGNQRVDYQNTIDSNNEAAGRAYTAEQNRMNETFMQAAFQKQDQLQQLIGAQGQLGASESYGNSARKMNQSLLSAFGRNNAIMSENLASNRSASMQRNYDTWRELASANNQSWSQVAQAPTETFAPQRPQMQKFDPTAALLGAAGSAVGSISKTPKSGDIKFNPNNDFKLGQR
jgi:hypothetical protein